MATATSKAWEHRFYGLENRNSLIPQLQKLWENPFAEDCAAPLTASIGWCCRCSSKSILPLQYPAVSASNP